MLERLKVILKAQLHPDIATAMEESDKVERHISDNDWHDAAMLQLLINTGNSANSLEFIEHQKRNGN